MREDKENFDEKKLNSETNLLSSPDESEERLENQKDWVSRLTSFCAPILVSGTCLFVFFTISTRRDSAVQLHSNSEMVASITASCYFNNKRSIGTLSITQSSELSNNSLSSSMSTDRKIYSNNSKVSSFHRTKSLNRPKTTFSFSIP